MGWVTCNSNEAKSGWNTLQICSCGDSNSGASYLWSNVLPIRVRRCPYRIIRIYILWCIFYKRKWVHLDSTRVRTLFCKLTYTCVCGNIVTPEFACLHVFQGESLACRLISTASMLEWLILSPLTPLTEKEYGKMEPKYPEGGHCQSGGCII